MTVDRFVASRRDDWDALESLVTRAKGRPERLGAADLQRLGRGYRTAAADLARARRLYRGEPAVERLEVLVGRARHLVYDASVRRQSLREFVATGYWRRVAERPRPLLVAALLLLGTGLASGLWALGDPGAAGGLVPDAFRSVVEPGSHRALSVGPESVQFAGVIFTNNVRVAALAFAGGIGAGVLTAIVLFTNGLLLGVVGGLAIGAGNGAPFFELVTAHGVLELSCIIVAGAAGFRLGLAVVDPGHRPRGEALRFEARAAVELLLGTAAWLGVAAFIEGFVTPAGIGTGAAVIVGVVVGATYWLLVLWRGRAAAPASADQSRASRFIRR